MLSKPSKQPEFSLGDPKFLENPAPMLAQMRDVGPLVSAKIPVIGKIWVTTTHAATSEVAKGRDRFFLTGQGAGLNSKGVAGLRWWMPPTFRAMANNMLGKDDPEHRRLRKLVDKAFARRGIRDMQPAIAAEAHRRATALGTGTVDLVPGFSRRFPLEVIAELLGVPDQDRLRFAQHAGALGELTGPLSMFRLMRSLSKMRGDLIMLIKQMRRDPQPGLISELIAVEENGDGLDEDELIAMVFLLLFAGFETTTNLISGSVLALEQNPDQKAWLLDDFDVRIETATEELCRFVSSISGTKPRLVAKDTVVDGHTVRRGEKIMAFPMAANYDPAVFDAPDQLQLDRFPNPHLAFSSGTHFCLGMQLARVELQEALRALYGVFPGLSLPQQELSYIKRPGHRALAKLMIDTSDCNSAGALMQGAK